MAQGPAIKKKLFLSYLAILMSFSVIIIFVLKISVNIRTIFHSKKIDSFCWFHLKSISLQCFSPKYIFKMSDIASKVKKIIVEKLGVDETEVTAEASFTNDLGADSLDTVELIMEFEKEFNVSIPDDQAENIQTVGQAITYLEENAK
jgi:acyl carrier protein